MVIWIALVAEKVIQEIETAKNNVESENWKNFLPYSSSIFQN